MCHTWGLARSPAELQGGQVQGHQGVPLQVKKHSLFSPSENVLYAAVYVWRGLCEKNHQIVDTMHYMQAEGYSFKQKTAPG